MKKIILFLLCLLLIPSVYAASSLNIFNVCSLYDLTCSGLEENNIIVYNGYNWIVQNINATAITNETDPLSWHASDPTEDRNFFLKDIENETHHINVDLENLDELYANVFLTPLIIETFYNASGDYVNITADQNETSITVNLATETSANNYRLQYNNIILPLYNGTNETPLLNRVYVYLNSGVPTWAVSLTDVVGKHAMAARILLGDTGTSPYIASLQEDGQVGFLKRVQRRFRKQGLLYEDGYDFNASNTDIQIGSGNHINGVYDIVTSSIVNSSVAFYIIQDNGTFDWYTDISQITEYSNGETIGTNKYFNVVWGVTPYDGNVNLMGVVQEEPSTEYNSMADAYEDSLNTLNVFPSYNFAKLNFLPTARTIINSLSDEFQVLPDGNYAIDYRGGIAGGIGSGGGIAESDPIWTADKVNYWANDGSSTATGDWDIDNYNFTANGINASKIFLGENGNPANYQSWIQERPSLTNNRIMIYGLADANNGFGYVISPTDLSVKDVYMNAWASDFDNPAVVNSYYGGVGVLGNSDSGRIDLFSGIKGANTPGDITISPGGVETASFDYDGNVTFTQGKIYVKDATNNLGMLIENYQDSFFTSGAWRYVASYGTAFPFDAGGLLFRYGDTGMSDNYNNMAGGFTFNAQFQDPVLTTPSGSLRALRLDSDQGIAYVATNDYWGWGSGYEGLSKFDGTDLIIQPNSISTGQVVIDDTNTFGSSFANGLGIGFDRTNARFNVEGQNSEDTSTGGAYNIWADYWLNPAGDTTGTKMGIISLVRYLSNYTTEEIRGANFVANLNQDSKGNITKFSNVISRLNQGTEYIGNVPTYNAFEVIFNNEEWIDIDNFYGLYIPTVGFKGNNTVGIHIGDIINGTNKTAIETGLGDVKFGDNVYISGVLNVNEINASSGSLKIYNASGWGTLEVGNITTHTIVDNSSDALEYFKLGNDYLDSNGEINHSAFGELHTKSTKRDFSNPQYTYTVKEVCGTIEERVPYNSTECRIELVYKNISYYSNGTPYAKFINQTICEDVLRYSTINVTECGNITDVEVSYPEIETEGILLNGQVAKLSQAMGLLNQNVNIYENLTDFDTGIMTEEMYFQSKAVNPNVDYISIFSDIVPFTEKHKSKYTTNITLPDKGTILIDNVEDQIKDVQGYILQNEFCRKNNNKWDDYNTCMNNGETLGQKK